MQLEIGKKSREFKVRGNLETKEIDANNKKIVKEYILKEMPKNNINHRAKQKFVENLQNKFEMGTFLNELDGMGKRQAFYLVQKGISGYIMGEFAKNSKHMCKHNEITAMGMVSKNKNTEFGRMHKFDEILNSNNPIKEFKKTVPISDYWDYEKQINRMAVGEKNILTKEDPTFFALTSGTTGKNKLIPTTKSSSAEAFKGVMLLNGMISKIIPGADSTARGINLMRMSDDVKKTPSGIPMGDASSGGIKKMAWMMPLLYTTPIQALTIEDKPSANYIHAVFGLKDKKLKHITSTFAPYVIQLLKNMEQRSSDILRTIATGKLPDDLKITKEQKADLEKLIKPDIKRAEELKVEFDKGFKNIVPRVWPEFKYVGAVTTGSFDMYIPELKSYIGKTPIYNGTYGASEGWMGVAHSLEKPKEFALIPGANYYEFIPSDKLHEKNPKTADIKDLKVGNDYEMVITTHTGFYRYRVGDVLTVKGFIKENPVVEFAYRVGSVLNLAGEKTTERQTNDAIQNFADEFLNKGKGGKLVDFTTLGDVSVSPPRYRFYIELKTNIELNDPQVKKAATKLLEKKLGETSLDYGEMRDKRELSEMEICFVKPGAFERLTEKMRNARNDVKLSNQIKMPRVLKNPEMINFLDKEKI